MNKADAPAPAPTGLALWWAGARPRTLPAAIVPVLVGTAAAAGIPHAGDLPAQLPTGALRGIIAWRLVAALVVALAIQVGTNYANDYSDGVRGTDEMATRVGPLRLVGSGLASPSRVKRAAFASFGVAAVAGLALAAAVTWWLIPLGLVCFAAGWFYTGGPRPYGYAGLGEVFVFVFFGIVATVGSAFVQVASLVVPAPVPGTEWPRSVLSYPWLVFAVSAAVGCLATALLVINNLRDIPTDTAVGKRTLAVKLGDRGTRRLYVALMVLPYLIVPVACGLGGRPLGAASLFAVVLANRPVLSVVQGETGRALIPVLGQTGRVQLAFGALLAAGLFLSA